MSETETTVTTDVYDPIYRAAVDAGIDPTEVTVGVEEITDDGDLTLRITEEKDKA